MPEHMRDAWKRPPGVTVLPGDEPHFYYVPNLHEVMQGVTEVLAYGTAVVPEKIAG